MENRRTTDLSIDMAHVWTAILLVWAAEAPPGPGRVLESVVPMLAYGPHCSSVVEIANVGGRPAVVELEGHRTSGALVPAGAGGHWRALAPGERKSFQLETDEETTGA